MGDISKMDKYCWFVVIINFRSKIEQYSSISTFLILFTMSIL
ncbi:hypothetical protein [Flagellimonas crocea]|nr:hypothetical protein [Muricauda sp. DH64]